MNRNLLRGKVAIVTGASSGIGRATAIALASHGASVALAARRHEALLEVAREITSRGGDAQVIPTDVTQVDEVRAMVASVIHHWHRVDILVSNAGEYIRRPALELDPMIVQRSFDINYFGGLNCIVEVLPHMLSQGHGHIVAVTSMDGKLGLPLDAPYVSAKFALTGLCEVLRKELREYGISVTNVLPGRVDTAMIRHLRFHPVSAKISPERVAGAVMHVIRRKTPVHIVPLRATLLYYVSMFAPILGDRIAKHFYLEGRETAAD